MISRRRPVLLLECMRRCPAGPGRRPVRQKDLSSYTAQPPSGPKTTTWTAWPGELRPPCRRDALHAVDFFRSRSEACPSGSALRQRPRQVLDVAFGSSHGRKVRCSTFSPLACIAPMTLSIRPRCTPESMTTPLGPHRCSGPASNWGLIRQTSRPPGLHQGTTAGKIFASEMNDTSMTTQSTGSGESPGFRWRALVRSITTTRGSLRSRQCSCP